MYYVWVQIASWKAEKREGEAVWRKCYVVLILSSHRRPVQGHSHRSRIALSTEKQFFAIQRYKERKWDTKKDRERFLNHTTDISYCFTFNYLETERNS